MQCKYYGNCKHQNESCKSNTALLKCVYGLNEYCTEKAWEIDALREENKELKRLLKMAIESFDYIDKEFGCAGCHKGWKKCPYNTGEKDCCTEKWKYYDEAMKLIGEEE